MSEPSSSNTSFSDLKLPSFLMSAIEKAGYENPSPIQAQAIPVLLNGRDLVGRAPTGTGKTAAFALPLLSRIDVNRQKVQVMVLTPTRELAIQVAEAFQRYASHIKDFHVLPIYGGQEYGGQIRQLKRGVHVVVGTPGRVMDHMRKGRLKLDTLQALVLDEGDEMLRMGFIDDVEWILEQTPEQRQTALFSATMPKEIQRIAKRHLRDPEVIAIKARTATADTIRQRFWPVSRMHKLDALTRILEVEPFDAVLMFVRTKTATTELAQRLEARGYATAALNGDMAQSQREQTVNRLRKGKLDILVATDVAARGLDVDRISHVVNYDIPYGPEAYIHRIGRTGRAGRQGEAILFVAPREKRMLAAIERATRHTIELMELPTTEMVNNKRIADFKQNISDTLAGGDLDFMQSLVEQYRQEHDVPALEIAAALAKISIGDRQLLLKPEREKPVRSGSESRQNGGRGQREKRGKREGRGKREQQRDSHRSRSHARPSSGMVQYRIEVGSDHDVQPGNIVGAIANESGLDSQHIGHIDIQPSFSLIDLPSGMPRDILQVLKKAWVCGQRLDISRVERPTEEKRDESKGGETDSTGHKSSDHKKRGVKTRRRKADGPRAKRRKKKK